MATGSKPFGRGEIRSWRHEKVEKGKTYEGWKCGEVCGVTMHENKERTQPCRVAYCGPSAICPGCDLGQALTWRGFVPYFRRADSRPCCIVIHEEMFAVADGVGHLKLMIAGRGGDKYDKTWVRAHLHTERFETANAARRDPQDLNTFLPTLLKCKDEISPFQFRRGPLVQPASNPPTSGDKKPTEDFINLKNRVAEHVIRQAGLDLTAPLLASDVENVLGQLANPPPNGKHKKRAST